MMSKKLATQIGFKRIFSHMQRQVASFWLCSQKITWNHFTFAHKIFRKLRFKTNFFVCFGIWLQKQTLSNFQNVWNKFLQKCDISSNLKLFSMKSLHKLFENSKNSTSLRSKRSKPSFKFVTTFEFSRHSSDLLRMYSDWCSTKNLSKQN